MRPARLLPGMALAALGLAAAAAFAIGARDMGLPESAVMAPQPASAPTDIGINLFGIAPYNRQQIFTNLIAQSEWFTTTGAQWTAMPAEQLDAQGWVRYLNPGQRAPRPLVLPPMPFSSVPVRCSFDGQGEISVGGIARLMSGYDGVIDLQLVSRGGMDEGAWIQIDRTDPADPVRNIACRDPSLPRDMIFLPSFVESLRGYAAIRFLDWQRVNDNPASRWASRTLPSHSSQAGPGGVAVEHMVALANEAQVDPWFIMPYDADADYIAQFARYVHSHLSPSRVAYVELGNEVWNDMFAAARQARAEGIAAGLAPRDDPMRAQMRRYAEKSRDALQIWTRTFADRPARLVRVVSTQNAWPELAEMILDYGDVAKWTDAVAVAPYIHLDLKGRGAEDADWAFSRMDRAIDETIDFAIANRAIAERHGKRLIAYEGGQHLVTRDMAFAQAMQRDPRMGAVYTRYLERWRDRVGGRMMLYASTAPITEWGAWGLNEYAGQPLEQTPKLAAVRSYLAASAR